MRCDFCRSCPRIGDPPRGSPRNQKALTPRRDNPPLSDRRSGRGKAREKDGYTSRDAHGGGRTRGGPVGLATSQSIFFLASRNCETRRATDCLREGRATRRQRLTRERERDGARDRDVRLTDTDAEQRLLDRVVLRGGSVSDRHSVRQQCALLLLLLLIDIRERKRRRRGRERERAGEGASARRGEETVAAGSTAREVGNGGGARCR